MSRGFEIRVLDGTNTRSLIRTGHDTVVVPVRCQEGLRCVFLTDLTRGRLFVPGTNPLRGPRTSFVDGGYSGNLSLGKRIGDGSRSAGSVFAGRRALLNSPIFMLYIIY